MVDNSLCWHSLMPRLRIDGRGELVLFNPNQMGWLIVYTTPPPRFSFGAVTSVGTFLRTAPTEVIGRMVIKRVCKTYRNLHVFLVY